MATNLNPASPSNMRIRDYAYLALCKVDDDHLTSRVLLGEMTQIKTGTRNQLLSNRYLPTVHKLALLLKHDNRFIKQQCPKTAKALWSVNNNED